MRAKILFVVGVATLVVSCARQQINGVPIVNLKMQTRQVEANLARSAYSVDRSLRELAVVQRAVYPRKKLPIPPRPSSIGMGKLATIDWTGPIEPLVRDIAKESNYRLRVLGRAPAIPVIVSVHHGECHPVPLATILRNAAYQCGNKVDIVAYPSRKVLELRYKNL